MSDAAPVYKRILLKVSGEMLAGDQGFGIQPDVIGRYAQEIHEVSALGVDIKLLFTLVFGLGAGFAGLAGMMFVPIGGAEIGMGELILINAFVVIVIGGIGSIRGAFIASLLTGIIDTLGRAFLEDLLGLFMTVGAAETAGRRS